MRLTRRGRLLAGVLLALLMGVGLAWAFVAGQNSRCRWWQEHGTVQQAARYCE